MPQPEGSQLNFGFSPILTKIGLSYLPKLEQFIGAQVFPRVPVASPVGTYNVWKQGDFLRRNGKEVANYEPVPLGGFASSQQTYSVKNWGVGTPYTARDLANARRAGTPDQRFKNAKARWCVTQGVLEMEFRVQSLCQTSANWTTTIPGVGSAPTLGTNFLMWDQTAATPVDDVLYWKRYMRQLTGFDPNTMIIPEPVYLFLVKNSQIISRITPGFTGAGQAVPMKVNLDHIKALFEVQTILVPKAVYNSAAEGQADVLVDIWTRNVMWMGYVTAAPSNEDPSAGYTFAWTGDVSDGTPDGTGTGEGPQNFGAMPMNEQGLFMREYLNQERAAVIIEAMLFASPNVVGASLGMTWTNVIT